MSNYPVLQKKYLKWQYGKKVADKGTDILPEPLKAIASGVLSLNDLDFVKIESTMGDKKVILKFDDLERANISTGDLFGCINDYCENLLINTIIVTNEEKIKPNDTDKIEYREIKERIIQRTYSVQTRLFIYSSQSD